MIETYGDIHRRELAEKQYTIDMLVDLLREGRNQSYGVMGIGTAKLRALEAWFAKVDEALASQSAKACDD
jgi:hypothetical protein